MSYQLSGPPSDELYLLWQSGHGLIVIETAEERRAIKMIVESAGSQPCFVWSSIQGLVSLNTEKKDDSNEKTTDLMESLGVLNSKRHPWISIFVDVHEHLKETDICRAMRETAERAARRGSCVIFISPVMNLPRELEPQASHFSFPVPDINHLEKLVKEEYNRLRHVRPNIKAELTQRQMEQVVESLIGFTEDQAKRLISQVILRDGRLDVYDIEELQEARRQAAATRGLLEIIPVSESLDDIGGLNRLKQWLTQRKSGTDQRARQFGLEPPKGVLLLGVQGCGKSLCAKAIAAQWKRPLLRLDVGSLYNKYIGATETNLRESLRQAEASSPCVLWVDEIEKAFSSTAGEGGDGGVSQRLFATMLGWMNDRTTEVFIAATANSISHLPPELMRKGRFDEIFFIDLPPVHVRRIIFSIHVRKRRRSPNAFDLDRLAEISEGFSGAEIEQAVISALYDAYEHDDELETKYIVHAVEQTSPMSIVLAERIDSLRRWADQRCVMAHEEDES